MQTAVYKVWRRSLLMLQQGFLEKEASGREQEKKPYERPKKMLEETNGLYSKVSRVLKSSTYDEYDDLSGLDINYRDGESSFFFWRNCRPLCVTWMK